MQKFIMTFLLCFILTTSFSQGQRNSSLYAQGQYNQTLSDVTRGNNPWGMGLGLQLFLANASRLKPAFDFTADADLMDDKLYRTYLDGTPTQTVEGMINLFAGASYQPVRIAYVSFVAGPSFVGGQTLFGVKPSIGFYFSAKKKLTGKISYINIFKREPRAKENFCSVSFSLGAKLF